MVGPFCGITAATLLHAAERHPDVAGDPLALTVNFLAPIADGEFEITPRIVRTNRTNQHWLIELAQDGEPKTTASAVFGIRRDTWSDTELAPPVVPGPEDAVASSFSDMVVWAQNYDMRFVTGAMPGVADGPDPDSTTTVWVRDRRGRAIDYTALTALCDVFYPRVFLRHGRAVPAGTITLTAGQDWTSPAGRRQYVPVAVLADGSVVPAHRLGSGSHLIGSLHLADGLGLIAAETTEVRSGDLVEFLPTRGY